MESNHFDVVVVGAGLSGLAAAGMAALQKLRVALVTTGPGSFVLGTGCVYSEEIANLDTPHDLGEAIAFYCEMARLAGCAYDGDLASQRPLPTILGNFERVALTPHPLWNTEPRTGSRTAIVGIRGLTGFDENFMAERMNEQACVAGTAGTYIPRQIALSRNMGIPVTTLRIAKFFDSDAGFRAELIGALRPVVSGFDRILLPSMLGLCSSDQQIAGFEQELGRTICEIPTLPPCIQGLRLFHRLTSHLQQIGVESFSGFPVEALVIRDGLCASLRIASPGHPLLLRGESVVLAAGHQSVNLLPETCAGLDRQARPLAPNGTVMAWNVFVAGKLRRHESESEGNAAEILAGYRAGKLAAATEGYHAVR
jgi:glycerol-3-phosphate dehydrogenase subunit B